MSLLAWHSPTLEPGISFYAPQNVVSQLLTTAAGAQLYALGMPRTSNHTVQGCHNEAMSTCIPHEARCKIPQAQTPKSGVPGGVVVAANHNPCCHLEVETPSRHQPQHHRQRALHHATFCHGEGHRADTSPLRLLSLEVHRKAFVLVHWQHAAPTTTSQTTQRRCWWRRETYVERLAQAVGDDLSCHGLSE